MVALPSHNHVFMSYSRRDEAVMRRVLSFLRKQGVRVWVDNEKLVPGTPIWEIEIEKAIKNAGAIVVICSPDSKNSEWVRREITVSERYHKRIFPVLVRGDEDSSITIRLSTRQYVDIRQDEEVGLNSLGTALAFYLEEFETQERRKREEQAKKAAAEEARKKREAEIKKEAEEKAIKALEERALREADEKIRRERETKENKIAKDKAELKKDIVEEKKLGKKYNLHPYGVGGIVVLVMIVAVVGATNLYRSISAPDTPTEETAFAEPTKLAEFTEPAGFTEPTKPVAAEPGDTEGPAPAAQAGGYGETLATVKARGTLICGGNSSVPGFGFIDNEGNFSGFDIDFCKAVAAAVFGDATKFEIRPLTAQERFAALQSGEIDILIRNTTWTLSRDTDQKANFVHTTFYDGQGFIVRKADGITTLEDLDGGRVCVQAGTTTELNLADVMAARGINYEPVIFADGESGLAAYEGGSCDAYTADKSGLVTRQTLLQVPDDHVILDETISDEPLGPIVRHGDDQWFDIVQWVVFATFFGEKQNITSTNVDQVMENTTNASERYFLGVEGELGTFMGLNSDWAYHVIKQVGNYEEIYNRNFGPDTPTYIPRGLNKLYTEGGLLYPSIFR